MEQQELHDLANGYKAALLDELKTKIALAEAKAVVDAEEARVLAEATASGAIDGKNAETRKIQTADVLANSATYQNALRLVKVEDDNAGHATVGRQYYDALLGLTKAWLYSQSGH